MPFTGADQSHCPTPWGGGGGGWQLCLQKLFIFFFVPCTGHWLWTKYSTCHVLGTCHLRISHRLSVSKPHRAQVTGRNNRNVRRDVTAWIGWQRSHHCHPLLTRQKRCFYKGQSLTWAHIFVVHSNIRNLPGHFKRGNISLPDDISQMKIYWQIKEKL